MNTMGERIAYYRKKKKMSQAAFAQAVGVGRSTVASWETNKRELQWYHRIKVCQVLDIDEGLILSEISTPNQTVAHDLGLTDDAIEALKKLVKDCNDSPDASRQKEILKAFSAMVATQRGRDCLFAIGTYILKDDEQLQCGGA